MLRTETVLDVLSDLRKKGSRNLKDDGEKALLGCSVITRYNNKTYKIDGIEFNENPKSNFTLSTGQTISYVDYYKKQYGLVIKDLRQPMLINRYFFCHNDTTAMPFSIPFDAIYLQTQNPRGVGGHDRDID